MKNILKKNWIKYNKIIIIKGEIKAGNNSKILKEELNRIIHSLKNI